MEFAKKIKQYRAQNKWTQQEVATKLDVSRKTVSGWEMGGRTRIFLCWSGLATSITLV